MIGYPSAQLREEVAALAHHFHWPYDQIVALDHRERRSWVEQAARLSSQEQDMERRPWH